MMSDVDVHSLDTIASKIGYETYDRIELTI